MKELEKILEEIDAKIAGSMGRKREGLLEAQDIIRKHVKNEEDILKFYYCESEDDYYLGQRVQNMYYAKYGPGGFTWFMSRYLPWGTDGYPSEPKEIPFMEWIEGFIHKHMNDGWIPVDKGTPEVGEYVLGTNKYGEVLVYHYGWNSPHTRKMFFCLCGAATTITAWRPLPEPYKPERMDQNEKAHNQD